MSAGERQRSGREAREQGASRGRAARWALGTLYWLVVLLVSLALVVGFLLVLESRDEPSIKTGAAQVGPLASP